MREAEPASSIGRQSPLGRLKALAPKQAPKPAVLRKRKAVDMKPASKDSVAGFQNLFGKQMKM